MACAAFVGLLADCCQEYEYFWRRVRYGTVPSVHHVNNFLTSGAQVGYLPCGIINIVTVVGIDYITARISSSPAKP